MIAVLAAALLLAGCAGNQGSSTGAQPPAMQAQQNSGSAQGAPPSGGAPAAGGNAQQTGGSAQAAQQPQPSNQSARIKLSDTQYWGSAYLISGDSLDDNTKAALAGFGYNRTAMPDGSLNVTLTALSPQYQGGSFLVEPGQKLYFIETSFGDDSGDAEYNMGDDMAVLVDSDGYVVQ